MSMPGPQFADAPAYADAAAEYGGFDVRRAVELDEQGLIGRLAFAGIYALLALAVMPWPIPAMWIGSLIVWELLSPRLFTPWMRGLDDEGALAVFALTNLVGSCIYSTVGLASLAVGSPIGIAMGATWLSGSFMNSFIYYGENRRTLWASMAPAIAAAIIGPSLIHGLTWHATAVSVMILTALVAARSFSLDHQVLLKRLGERKSKLAEVERKLSIAVEASGDGLFESDMIAGTRQVSAGWAAMVGYDLAEIENPVLLDFVHPDDRARVEQDYLAHFSGE